MLLRRTSAPVSYPVTLDEAKLQARIDLDVDNILVAGYIAAASRAVGEMSGRAVGSETWELSVKNGISGKLYLPRSPVQSITSITYYDSDDVQQTADIADFYLIGDDDTAYIEPKAGKEWPSANSDRADAITVTFVCGYGRIPDTLRQAVLMLVAHYYENRMAVSEAAMSSVPYGVEHLVSLERIGWAAA